MGRPRLLDLFCGAGGCAVGYHRAGFDVLGVDHRPQNNYPFKFVQADALCYLRDHGRNFDAIHASPPCQRYSRCRNMTWITAEYPDLLPPVLAALDSVGRPWVVENVPGAPLPFPIMLCGTHFGLPLWRHRLFRASFLLLAPATDCRHEVGHVTFSGNRSGVLGLKGAAYKCSDGQVRYRRPAAPMSQVRGAFGIDWMTRAELAQAIPPAYTEFVGRQLLRCLDA